MTLTIRAVDTMKASRDRNNLTAQQMIDHCNAIVRYCPECSHICLDVYTNNFGYHSVAYIQLWVDAIRGTGKKIWWRPAFLITKAGEEATLAEIYASIIEGPSQHPEWFASGDIFELQPETHPYIGELNGTAQDKADWNAWIRDSIAALETMFENMDYTIDTRIVSVTDGYAKSGVLEAATCVAMGNRICYDSYPLDSTSATPLRNVQGMLGDLITIHTLYPDAEIIMSEFGYNNIANVSDSRQREQLRVAFNAIAQLPYVTGVNYWVGFNSSGGGGYTQLFETGSLTSPRPALKTLGEFYAKGACTGRQEVV